MDKTHNYIGHSGIRLVLLKPLPVKPLVWFNRGLYGLLSVEQVQNANGLIIDYTRRKLKNNPPVAGSWWNEVKILERDLARKLIDEKSGDKNQDTAGKN